MSEGSEPSTSEYETNHLTLSQFLEIQVSEGKPAYTPDFIAKLDDGDILEIREEDRVMVYDIHFNVLNMMNRPTTLQPGNYVVSTVSHGAAFYNVAPNSSHRENDVQLRVLKHAKGSGRWYGWVDNAFSDL